MAYIAHRNPAKQPLGRLDHFATPGTPGFARSVLNIFETADGMTMAEAGYHADEFQDVFGDMALHIRLAAQGIFSCDTTAHRAKRDKEAEVDRDLDDAFACCGLNRKAEYERIAKEVAPRVPEGIWPTSHRFYADARAELNRVVLEASERRTSSRLLYTPLQVARSASRALYAA